MRKNIIILICILLCNLDVVGQNQANFWFFGENAGLNFNNDTVVAVTDGALFTTEGCATMSDINGNLLFYTDGTTVWNREHTEMLGLDTTKLLGDISSTQSAIIIPKPDVESIYYIFTVDWEAKSNGLQYSEVNMNLSGGLGGITANKNIPLEAPVTEKLTAVRHANGKDIWVIVHQWNNNVFSAYLVTNTGVNTTPIRSNSGAIITGDDINTHGYMKASPNGEYLAVAHQNLNLTQIFNLDDSTGIISNATTLITNSITQDTTIGVIGAYGLEFSQNSRFLYVGESLGKGDTSFIYQYDFHANNIPNSVKIIGKAFGDTTLKEKINIAALQLGPDNKIYIASRITFIDTTTLLSALRFPEYLGVINHPDSIGTISDYQQVGIDLNGRKTKLGLPTFLPAIFNCKNTPIDFGADTVLCFGDNLTLIAGKQDPLITYLWKDSSSTPSLTVNKTGEYYVESFSTGCLKNMDTISVKFDFTPNVNLGNDVIVCDEENLLLQSNEQNASFIWQDGVSTKPFLEINSSGLYWVTASRGSCSDTDSILVDFCIRIPNIITPNDDDMNDEFAIKHIGVNANLSIYNRWGKQIFQQENYTNDWKAKDVTDGVYYYKLNILETEYKGWLQILR